VTDPNLASEIARLWRIDGGGTAPDLAVMEGFASMDGKRPCWERGL
jgi:hypothetical protein